MIKEKIMVRKLVCFAALVLASYRVEAASVSTSFQSVTSGASILVFNGETFAYSIVNTTATATVVLERSFNGTNYLPLLSFTTTQTNTFFVDLPAERHALYRFRCSTITQGTMATVLQDVNDTVSESRNLKGITNFRLKDDGMEVPGYLLVSGTQTFTGATVFSGTVNGSSTGTFTAVAISESAPLTPLSVAGGSAISATTSSGFALIGAPLGNQLVLDNSGFQAKSSSFSTTNLFLQPVGSSVVMGTAGTRSTMTATGALTLGDYLIQSVMTAAQINAVTPLVLGARYTCSNCTLTYSTCVATGTAASQLRKDGLAAGCN